MQINSIKQSFANANNINPSGSKCLATPVKLNSQLCDEVSFSSSASRKELAFEEYKKGVDFYSLIDIVPEISDYSADDYEDFLRYHFECGTKEFTKETLAFPQDLTSYFAENFVGSDELFDIYRYYPLTDRKIGEVPEGILSNIEPEKREEAINKLYKCIGKFASKKIYDREVKEFEKEIRKILNRSCIVQELEAGSYGKGYRLLFDTDNDYCLKVFESVAKNFYSHYHGKTFEPQVALFINNHSNKFVKMFFGQTARKKDKDGFLVTQYMTLSRKPCNENDPILGGYKIKAHDVDSDKRSTGHNKINNVIIDFGGVEARETIPHFIKTSVNNLKKFLAQKTQKTGTVEASSAEKISGGGTPSFKGRAPRRDFDMELSNAGFEPFYIFELKSRGKETVLKALDIANKGFQHSINPYAIATDEYKESLYNKFLEQGVEPRNASTLACVRKIGHYDKEDIKAFEELISKIETEETKEPVSIAISNHISDYVDFPIKDFVNYINSIDYDKLVETAPRVKGFQPSELLKFYQNCYENNITDFNRETFVFCDNMTEYLSNEYVNADELENLLTKYPNTSRHIGSIPNISDEKMADDIYGAIAEFANDFDVESLGKKLSKAMDKEVKVDDISSGSYGYTYKITSNGMPPLCLKVFKKNMTNGSYKFWDQRNNHGPWVEPQVAFFVNVHSDKYVKAYFGQIAGENDKDAFLVTQFLDCDNRPIENENIKDDYQIFCGDLSEGSNRNVLWGKIIDFGAIYTRPGKTQEQ